MDRVNEISQAEELEKLGVNGIFSDHPGLLQIASKYEAKSSGGLVNSKESKLEGNDELNITVPSALVSRSIFSYNSQNDKETYCGFKSGFLIGK